MRWRNDPRRESRLREKLRLPADAERILIFGETSHWDPNWLRTSEEYFEHHIRKILDAALAELETEKRRVFSVESLFFLKMYWERHPERQPALRRLLNEGRLRLTGVAMTTPDTTLPDTEAILRDYLRGSTWLESVGVTQKPRLAYFPDGFGHSPGVPAILEALGMEYAAVSRIDGMNFPATDYRPDWAYPRPGSNAWLLLKELRTLDFVWRSPDRAQVLTHWNSHTYFQGDNIVYIGPTKWMGKLYGLARSSEAHVEKRIGSFVAQLAPLARTPYLFCPIGMDFNRPIPGLMDLLDRYNRKSYPKTGVFTLLAGLDDYLDLVSCRGEELPVLDADFNPYWMGFYASRPRLKQRVRDLTRDLRNAETLSLLAADEARRRGKPFEPPDLTQAWDHLIVSNHHDFITGTSTDRVYEKEQLAWLVDADRAVAEALGKILPASPPPPRKRRTSAAPAVKREGEKFVVETRAYRVTIDGGAGGCIRRWVDRGTGRQLLAGFGNDAVLFEDSGGLWRMGHEFAGGILRVLDRASLHAGTVDISTRGDLLEVVIASELGGKSVVRRLWFREGTPVVRMRLEGSLAEYRTLTVRFSTTLSPRSIRMDVPGAVIERPCQKIFNPTFWAASTFAHVKENTSDRGLAVALYCPASLSADPTGVVEWIALRNAPKETAFRVLPVLAHPASGHEPGPQSLDYAAWFTSRGDWRANRVPSLADEALRPSWLESEGSGEDRLADSLVTSDEKGVRVTAVKPAGRGEGVIVRLCTFGWPVPHTRITYRGRSVRKAWACTALEENLESLSVNGGKVKVPLQRSITTVRLVF